MMPEATPDLYGKPLTRKDDIRFSRQIATTYPETQPETMQSRAETKLGLGIVPLDVGHVSRPAGRVDGIGHFYAVGCDR